MPPFRLEAPYRPAGDQPQAIDALVAGARSGKRDQVLLGVTGSGKTYAMANIIAALQRPTLVMSHNKTLAAQLYQEFREFFPDNAVEYYVSYFDYYLPESYVPQTDTYIEKDTQVNDEIERLRHHTLMSLMSRRDVIVVASVSCIYGAGAHPDEVRAMHVVLTLGQQVDRDELLRALVRLQYERTSLNLDRSKMRVRGDVIDLWMPGADDPVRIELDGDRVERLSTIDPLRGDVHEQLPAVCIYPAEQFVTPQHRMEKALTQIEAELQQRLAEFDAAGKPLYHQRLQERTMMDLELLRETGRCNGIENYSLYLTGRAWGQTPYTLMEYLPPDTLIFVDESHVSVPQVRGMYLGDRSRKEVLVEYGFRLPSALENRPLTFDEWRARAQTAIFVSATPATYELGLVGGERGVVQMVVRPTGLLDPRIEVAPTSGQVDDLLGRIRARVTANERVLVTTLTKRMAEDLAQYFHEAGVKVRYLHSDIDTLERMEILRDLKVGLFDVLVGINLLREGLDLPEVSLVAILDADKEGFLRSAPSLVQTIGRAARNVNGSVVMYADRVTDAMATVIALTTERRERQQAYNASAGIVPRTISKPLPRDIVTITRALAARQEDRPAAQRRGTATAEEGDDAPLVGEAKTALVGQLRTAMEAAATRLEFERAAKLRDQIRLIEDGASPAEAAAAVEVAAAPMGTYGGRRWRKGGRH